MTREEKEVERKRKIAKIKDYLQKNNKAVILGSIGFGFLALFFVVLGFELGGFDVLAWIFSERAVPIYLAVLSLVCVFVSILAYKKARKK